MRSPLAFVSLVVWLPACAGTAVEPKRSNLVAQAVDAPAPVPNESSAPASPIEHADGPGDLRPLVHEVASSYRSWGMVDAQFHWAPGDCAMPLSGVAHMSTAEQPGAHAEKVFLL